ncbi:MAG: hypothetical protein QF577_00795 [Phycisphaerae bacterium]|jgi:hypothetical protein|nr:hypothetical protein [Phycisphaerae bacterium]MDP7636062.1 hypothetical protein [Phycisphaerae bacterium]
MLILAQGGGMEVGCVMVMLGVVGTVFGTLGGIFAFFRNKAKPSILLGVVGVLSVVLNILALFWLNDVTLSEIPDELSRLLCGIIPFNPFITVPLGVGTLSVILGVVRRKAVPLGEKWLFIPGIVVLLLIAVIIYLFLELRAAYLEM